MNKKTRATSLLILVLTIITMQAQSVIPSTVRQFLNERQRGDYMSCISRFAPPYEMNGQEVVDAFVAIDNENTLEELRNHGVNINCIFDGFITAQIPVHQLIQVSHIQGVSDIEVSPKAELCTDSTMNATFVNQVQNGINYGLPKNYDGSGVIVGIIDKGFDYQHLAFMSSNHPGQSRIVRVYDTRDTTGHPAKVKGSVLSGSVFMGNEILSLDTDDSNTAHGSHTASIATGSHVNGYGGMAPGADLVLCAVSVFESNLSIVEVANCIRYINCYADSVNKPCVISLSVSTSSGSHDGTDYLSRIIRQNTGPGRIFVIAAGNNGNRPTYAHKVASPTSPINLLFKYKNGTAAYDSTYYYENFQSEIWSRANWTRMDYSIHILDVVNNQIVWESEKTAADVTIDASQLGNYYGIYTNGGSAGFIQGDVGTSSDGKKYRLTLSVQNLISKSYTTVNGAIKSRYALGVTIYPRKESDIDAWVLNGSGRFGSYNKSVSAMNGETLNGYTASNSDCSIGTYAVHDSIISAGAYIARNSYYSLIQNRIITDNSAVIGQITNFSSYQAEGVGPTGKALPTVCAPGYYVIAAGNRYNNYAANSTATVMRTDDGSCWCILSGTSMAAPTVAGIIALWLQVDPTLSVSDIKNLISTTSIQDSFTNGSMKSHFGANGKINAMAGLQTLLKQQGSGSGDVNGDGEFNILDLTLFIDHLLGANEGYFNERAADLDYDGDATILDVTIMIDRLLTAHPIKGGDYEVEDLDKASGVAVVCDHAHTPYLLSAEPF